MGLKTSQSASTTEITIRFNLVMKRNSFLMSQAVELTLASQKSSDVVEANQFYQREC